MKWTVALMAFGIVLTGCVSSKQYKDLEKRQQETARVLDSLKMAQLKTSAELAEANVANTNLNRDNSTLKEDTLAKGKQLRDCQTNYANALLQNKIQEENYLKLLKGNQQETTALMVELRNAQAKLQEREDALRLLEASLNEKTRRLQELEKILADKDKDVERLRMKVLDALKGFKDSGLTVEVRNGKVYVSMSEKLLFATGSAEVDKKGEEALKQLALVLEKDTTINVMIEGHTDNVPLKGTGCNKDNWDLSVQRATTIVRILLKNGKIEANRLIPAGRGEFLPIAPNDTPENRSKNRRTEIILTPKLNELFQILEQP